MKNIGVSGNNMSLDSEELAMNWMDILDLISEYSATPLPPEVLVDDYWTWISNRPTYYIEIAYDDAARSYVTFWTMNVDFVSNERGLFIE